MIGGGSLGKLVVYLGADAADLVTEMSRAEREAAKSAKAIEVSLKAALAAAATAMAAGAVAVGTAIKQATDRADELAKAAQRAGVALEQFSKLNYAAALSDVDTGKLQQAFASLSKRIVDEASTASQALESLGVKTRDAYGNIRPSDAVLTDIASLFASFENGATKAALAQELFGDAGLALIPLLDSGAEGFRSMAAEAEALGLVVSQELGVKAQELNDNVTRLESAWTGFGNQLAQAVVPALASASSGLVDFVKNSNAVYIAADGVINVMKGLVISASLVKQGLDVIARSIIGVFETAAESINFLLRLSDAAAAGIRRTKAQIAANSIEEFKAASNLEGFADVFTREFSAYTAKVENIWGATADGFREDIADLVGAFESLRGAAQIDAPAVDSERAAMLAKIQALLDRLAASSRTAADATKKQAEADREAAKAAREVAQARDGYLSTLQGLLREYDPLTAAANDYRTSILELVKAHQLGAISTEELERAQALLERKFTDTTDAARKAANEMTPFQVAVRSLVAEIEALNAGGLSGIEAEFRQITGNMEGLTVEQQNALRGLLQIKEEATRWAATMDDASRSASDALAEFATEALFDFDNIGDAWEDLGDSLVNTAKRMVAQMLSEFLRLNVVKPLLDNIFGIRSSGGGGAFAGATAGVNGQSSGLPSWLSGLAQNAAIGFGLGGTRGAVGGSILGAVGSVFGPIGQTIGSIIGGILGGLTGKKPDDYRFGGATSRVRSPEGSFQTDFGTVRAGSRGLSYEELIKPIQDFDSAINDMLTSLGAGAPQLEAIRSALSSWSVDLKGDAATAENVLNSRFGAILGTFSADVQEFVGAAGTVEERVQRLNDALQIQNIVDTGDLGSSFDEVAAILEEFRATGEDLGATYQRLMAATGVYESALQVLGESFSGNRQELIQFAADFAEAAGGVSEAAGLWQSYFDVFLTEAERLQAAVDAARSSASRELGDIGLDPATTREQFRAAFDAIRSALSPQDLVQWLEAGRAIGVLIDAEGNLADFRAGEAAEAARALEEAERAAREEAERLADAVRAQTDFARGLSEQLQDDALSQYGDRLAAIVRRYRENIQAAQELGDATGDTAATMRSMALAARIARNGLAEVRAALIESIQGLVQQLGYAQQSALAQVEQASTGTAFGSFGSFGGGGAIEEAGASAESFFEQLRSGFESLEEWLNQSIFGELSGLSPEAQYAEVLQQIQEAATLIRGGGEGAAEALQGFPQLLDRFLQLSRTINASGSNFTQDAEFARALAAELLTLASGLPPAGSGIITGSGGGGGGGGGGPGDAQGVTGGGLTEADRVLLATQLAQQLRELAAITTQPLLDLAQTFGVDLQQFFTDLGVDLSDLSAANVGQLAGIANQLGLDLSDIDATLGLGLGELSDALSPINDALESVIDTLPEDLQNTLEPLLSALENAETPEERAAARAALVGAILAANPDLQALFAPFFDEIDNADELSLILGQITDVADNTGLLLAPLGAVKTAVEGVSAPITTSIDSLITATSDGLGGVIVAINALAAQQAAAATTSKAAGAALSIPETQQPPGLKATQQAESVVVSLERALDRIAARNDEASRQNADLIIRLGSDIRDGIERGTSRNRAAGGSYGC